MEGRDLGVWEGSEGSSREEKGFGLEGLEVQVPMADENGESSFGENAMLVSEGFSERDRRDIERESDFVVVVVVVHG